MGCCCCCCSKAPERLPRRSSSFSDLETVRPAAADILSFNHQEIPAPFLDINPILLEPASRLLPDPNNRFSVPDDQIIMPTKSGSTDFGFKRS